MFPRGSLLLIVLILSPLSYLVLATTLLFYWNVLFALTLVAGSYLACIVFYKTAGLNDMR